MDILDNPYTTIIQYCQMFAVTGRTVEAALAELFQLMESAEADNKNAERRIANAQEFILEEFPEDLRTSEDPAVQSAIVLAMQLRLHTKYPEEV